MQLLVSGELNARPRRCKDPSPFNSSTTVRYRSIPLGWWISFTGLCRNVSFKFKYNMVCEVCSQINKKMEIKYLSNLNRIEGDGETLRHGYRLQTWDNHNIIPSASLCYPVVLETQYDNFLYPPSMYSKLMLHSIRPYKKYSKCPAVYFTPSTGCTVRLSTVQVS